jgi:hypothetical protein
MIEMRAAQLAGVVHVIIAIWRHKAVAFKLLTLAHYASAATGYPITHMPR